MDGIGHVTFIGWRWRRQTWQRASGETSFACWSRLYVFACRLPVSQASALCTRCWMKLSFIEPPFCDRLGTPFPYDQGEGAISAAAIADPPPWDRARAAVIFDDLSRQLVHALKYRDRHEAAS